MAFEFGKRVLRGGVLGVALALAAALAVTFAAYTRTVKTGACSSPDFETSSYRAFSSLRYCRNSCNLPL